MRRDVVRVRQTRRMFWNDLQQKKRRMDGVEDVLLVEDTNLLAALRRVMGVSFGVGVTWCWCSGVWIMGCNMCMCG